MKLSTLLIKYILHKGIDCKQKYPFITDGVMQGTCDAVELQLLQAKELTGIAISKEAQFYKLNCFNFKGKRYKDCKLELGVDSIPLNQKTNFLIIENPDNADIPIILYHEPT